jgi:hypothetical protein
VMKRTNWRTSYLPIIILVLFPATDFCACRT